MKRNSLGGLLYFLYAKNRSSSIWAEFFTTDIFLVSKPLEGSKTKLLGGFRGSLNPKFLLGKRASQNKEFR